MRSQKICPSCGKVFRVNKTRNGRRYCSRKCRNLVENGERRILYRKRHPNPRAFTFPCPEQAGVDCTSDNPHACDSCGWNKPTGMGRLKEIRRNFMQKMAAEGRR